MISCYGIIHYQCFRTDEFNRSFRKLDSSIQKIIDKAIREVLFNQPYKSKKLVSPELKSKRSLRAQDYRVVFAICEECRESNYMRLNGCKDCKKHGTNDIIMFTCTHRKHAYKIR